MFTKFCFVFLQLIALKKIADAMSGLRAFMFENVIISLSKYCSWKLVAFLISSSVNILPFGTIINLSSSSSIL